MYLEYIEAIWFVSDTKHNIFNGLGLMFGLAGKMAIVLAHFPIKDDKTEQILTGVYIGRHKENSAYPELWTFLPSFLFLWIHCIATFVKYIIPGL